MLKSAAFRFHNELNDFLGPQQRNAWIDYTFYVSPSVKNVIEALGIPHPEVNYIFVNNHAVEFTYLLQHGDEVEVYPINYFVLPFGFPLNDNHFSGRFFLDVHLGKLAKALRLLGFDCLYENNYADETIVRIAASENRTILTRDLLLLQHSSVKSGYWIRSQHLEEQVFEVIKQFNLQGKFKSFTRCLVCNGTIKKVAKESVVKYLLPGTEHYFNEFFQCEACKRIYWRGSHFDRLQQFVKEVVGSLDTSC